MKSLIISLLYPLPENMGGSMRTMNFVRFFKMYGDVDLLYLNPESKQYDTYGPFRKELCILTNDGKISAHEKYRDDRRRRFRERLNRMAERRPWMLKEWTPRAVSEMVSLLTSERYDVILCRYIHNSFPLFRLPVEIRKRIIIDLDDFYSDVNFKRPILNPWDLSRKIKYFIEKHLVTSYQKRCLNFGAVLVCSKMDYDVLSMNRKMTNVFIIPNSYPIDRLSSKINSAGYENRNVFLFVGTLNYGPNSNGLEWFIESIFPYIKKVNRTSILLVVGRDPEEKLIAKCSGIPGIELHANVPDVGPFYERCGIVVVPILSGGGTRIKILEAGMNGRPVFSTPFGAYGLDLKDGEDIMIFNDHNSFIEKYERMNLKEMYDKINNNLKITVEMKYSTESFNKEMRKVINNLATIYT